MQIRVKSGRKERKHFSLGDWLSLYVNKTMIGQKIQRI